MTPTRITVGAAAGRSAAGRPGGAAPPTLDIRLLGELDLRRNGDSLPPLESARAESLLAYLLVHRGAAQPRQRLAFMLWPDSTEPQARTNLRHVLHKLRRALPDADRFVDVTQRTLRWRPDAPFRLDVAAFEEALEQAERDGGGIDALRDAAAAYGGDLLEGSYDEWVLEAYRLTGPEALTYGQIAEELSRATGAGVEYVDVPEAAARGAFEAAGMPGWLVEHLVGMFRLIRDDAFAETTDTLRRLTGREPRTFAAFARDHAALFRRDGVAAAGR